jgi:hypothetical protein
MRRVRVAESPSNDPCSIGLRRKGRRAVRLLPGPGRRLRPALQGLLVNRLDWAAGEVNNINTIRKIKGKVGGASTNR